MDIAHFHAAKEYLELVVLKMKNLIGHVHLADSDGTQAIIILPVRATSAF